MLVYGDRKRRRLVAPMLDGIVRGGETAFFDAAELAQGLIDAEFWAQGADDLTPLHQACLDLVRATWRRQGVADAARALRALALPAEVEITTPEGYAFYAVYPEAYRRAAAAAPWSAPPLVIGLRSIGTGLAAVVAEATGGAGVTLRPVGRPFRREVRAAPALRRRLAAHTGEFAVVDEGPGLSGSSFAAAAGLLEALGVAAERMVFFPSHAGSPGPQASPDILRRWSSVRRIAPTLDDLLATEPISGWFEDRIGPVRGVQDLSGGAWRTPEFSPPADPARERRKFRLFTAEGAYVARFAGLGRVGAEKLERARRLSAVGFGPPPIALRRGFLLARWVEGRGVPPVADGDVVDQLARYLSFRAAAFPAEANEGADDAALAEMIAVNAGLQVEPPEPGPRLQVDGRLHAWEWRRRPDGSLCKLDGLDHAGSHDLIGCQPIEYDIAGAVAEFGLDAAAADRLLARVGEAGVVADRRRLAFFLHAYRAFQAGLWSLAPDTPEVLAQRARYGRSPC